MRNSKDNKSEFSKQNFPESFFAMLGPSDIVGFLAAAIGAIAAILGLFKNPVIYVVLIMGSEVLLLIGWGVLLRFRYKNEIEKNKKEYEISVLSNRIDDIREDYQQKNLRLNKDREFAIKQLHVISNAVKSNNIHNNDILVRIPYEGDDQYENLRNMKLAMNVNPDDEQLRKEIQKKILKQAQGYANHLFDIFNRYCRDSTGEAVKLQNAYLVLKKIPLQVSITIKLLKEPFDPAEDDIKNVRVYTAFRDNETYTQTDREIGSELYSITGNSALITCLKKDYYTIDNVKKDQGNYSNEHTNFDDYYNCTLVVPIKLRRADNGHYKFFGFYCCDCKNEDASITHVFSGDKAAGQYLYAFAQNTATFLETLDANWIDRFKEWPDVSKNILEMLFKKVFKAEK